VKKEKFYYLLPVFLIPFYYLVDIITKMIVVKHLPYQKYVPVLGNFAGFTYIFNTGAAFGLFSNLNPLLKNILFTLVTLSAIAFIAYLMFKTYKDKKIYRHSCALILAGAFGNLSDRIFGYFLYGDINIITGENLGRKFQFFFAKVVDFINIGYGNPYGYSGGWRWPYFNAADSFITIGLTILIITVLFSKEKKKNDVQEIKIVSDNAEKKE